MTKRVSSLTGTLLMRPPVVLLCVLCALLPLPAVADGVRIASPWLREPPPGRTGAAIYLEISNAGGAAVVLAGASVDGATGAEVHGHTMHDGMMHMGPAGPLRIDPGASLAFEPGGYHLMVSGLAVRPVAGGSLPFCLMFEGGVRVCAEALVKGVAGT